MLALVTGAAGFIGSTLSEALLAAGYTVRGVDSFTPYYDVAIKRQNVALLRDPRFELVEADLRVCELGKLLTGAQVVFHQAAQPGVRLSWADGFVRYNEHNTLATQRLLEAAKNSSIERFIYASSSSIYGNAASYPVDERDLPQPHSPYGVTKLAGEHLCQLYAANWGVPTVSLRYFTVYGPRQRPDMAIHRLFEAGLDDEPFQLFGTGEQVRDFTFVGDVVRANVLAATAVLDPGAVMNIAGGSSITVNDLIAFASSALGREIEVTRVAGQAGDVDRTGGSIHRAGEILDWKPEHDLAAGLEAQAAWHLSRRR